MKKFAFNVTEIIPSYRLNQVISLNRFIEKILGVKISLIETYVFWCKVSEDLQSSWLSTNYYTNNYDPKNEFVKNMLIRYGHFIEE